MITMIGIGIIIKLLMIIVLTKILKYDLSSAAFCSLSLSSMKKT